MQKDKCTIQSPLRINTRQSIQQIQEIIVTDTGQLVERSHVRFWSRRSEDQILGRSNRTQSYQRLATAATFLRVEACCPGAMTQRWAPLTRYTLRSNTASLMKERSLMTLCCRILLSKIPNLEMVSFLIATLINGSMCVIEFLLQDLIPHKQEKPLSHEYVVGI